MSCWRNAGGSWTNRMPPMLVELAESMVHEAGFEHVEVKDLDEDPFNAYFVATKAASGASGR